MAFRSSTTASSDPLTGTITLSKPAGAVDGDLLVAVFVMPDDYGVGTEPITWDGTVGTAPSGWTLFKSDYVNVVDESIPYYIFTKIASGEGSSWTWSVVNTPTDYTSG